MSAPKRPHDDEPLSSLKRLRFDAAVYNFDLLNEMEQVEFILSKDFTGTKQNLFRFNLIDCLYLFNQKYSTNFKLFARALQAATKLYICKVDFIRQVLINLELTLKTNFDETNDNDDEFESQDEFSTRKKKNSKKRSKSTIVANLNYINAHKLETNCLIDPIFHQFSSNFDESNSNCLLLSHLQTDPLGVILFNAEDRLNFSSMPLLPNMKMNINIKQLSPADDLSICCFDKFRNFDFCERNSELLQSITMDTSASFLYHETPTEILNQFSLFAEDYLPTMEEQPVESKLFSCIEPDLLGILSEDDNHFFNANFLRHHFRNMHHVSKFYGPKLNNSKQQKLQSSKQKTTFPVRSTNHYRLISEELAMLDETNQLNRWEAKIGSEQNYVNFLKDDYGFVPAQLRELFSQKSLTDNRSTIDQSDMQSDNNVQSLNYLFNCEEENEYEYIPPLDISFAEVATRINMKLLKKGMSNAIKTESIDASLSHLFASGTSSSADKVLSFTTLNEQLDHYLNPSLRKGSKISLQTKFVTLLHLCNEKKLTLQPIASNDEHQDNHELDLKTDTSDFNIFSASDDITNSSSSSNFSD